jgi:hypothetical protein
MANFALIPKYLMPRVSSEYRQKIPKIIWQTMTTNKVPIFMKKYSDSWIELNPEYEYKFYDDADIIEFIEIHFPSFLEGYKKIKYGASKADLWRYLIIYKYGGIYADIDCRCIKPLQKWINSDSNYVTQIGINSDICQWLLISCPKNELFLKAAILTLKNIQENNSYVKYSGFELKGNNLNIKSRENLFESTHKILSVSGPPVLQKAAEECFVNGIFSEFLTHIQVVCTSGKTSCQMNGNVKHDCANASYIKALKILKTRHYEDRILLKAIRKIRSFFFLTKKKI